MTCAPPCAALGATLFAVLALAASARAEVTPDALARVGVHAPPGAAEPLSLAFRDAAGRRTTLADAVGRRPTLLVFEDFRCQTLCGPALAIAAHAIGESRLRPGRDIQLVSVGLRPGAPTSEAARFRDAHLAGASALRSTAAFLTGDAATVARATAAVGYGYAYDRAADQFDHPVAAFMLAPGDGRLVRTLEQTALDPQALRSAAADAQAGRVGDLVDRLALLCHGLWPTGGRYDDAVQGALKVAGLASLLAIGAGLAWLAHRRRVAA